MQGITMIFLFLFFNTKYTQDITIIYLQLDFETISQQLFYNLKMKLNTQYFNNCFII